MRVMGVTGVTGVEFAPAWNLAGPHATAVLRDGKRIEDQLTLLAASVGPLRRALAVLAARLIEAKGYERLGFARLADYGRERPGLSARQLQDLARVHWRLMELPALERALVENRLPWSKVRLLVRVASAADEAAWIERAAPISTRQLEQEVRAAGSEGRGGGKGEEETRVRLTIRCTPEVAQQSGTPSADEETWHGEEASPRRVFIDERAPARPLPALERLVEGLDAAGSFELDRRLMQAVRLEQTLEAASTPMLKCVTSPEFPWKHAWRSLADYARDTLGMSASKARALVRLGDAASFVPELARAYLGGELSWVKAQCLLPLFLLDVGSKSEDWRPSWVRWARRVTVRRLEADVRAALAMRTRTSTGFARCLYHPDTVGAALSPQELREQQMCAREEGAESSERIDLWVEPEVAWLFEGVREALRAEIQREQGYRPTDSAVFERLLARAVRAWTARAPGARRPDPVIEREGYRCAVPGCTSRRNLHDHHIVFRSAGGSDAESNRVTLCAFHHQRGVHRGELAVRGRAPDALVFDLGLRAGWPPLARYESGDLRVAYVAYVAYVA
jgi:hypothetical protein